MKPFILTALILCAATLTLRAQEHPIYQDETRPIDERVEDALRRMTLDEKVAICHAQSKFSSPGVPRLGIPELRYSDGPHGVRAEVQWNSWSYAGWNSDSCTAFPALTCLAATWDPAVARRYGEALGEEARYRRKSVILGPGVNIYRTPLNGRNFEYMGEDPYLAAEMCVPYIQGVQSRGVACSVKHFALNNQELHRWTTNVAVSDRALYEIYLPAFKAAVQRGGTWTLMGSYNSYQGVHCCHNATLLNDILKRDWGFTGAVISDWGGTHDTREAALNGLDIEMGTSTNGLTEDGTVTYDGYFLANPFKELLRKGEIPMSVLDDKCRRILRLIYRTEMNRSLPFGSLASPEHAAVCRAVGTAGIVLLKNDPLKTVAKSAPDGASPLLPIDATRYGRILVVGENATRTLVQAGGSSELKPRREVSPLQGLTERFGEKVLYAQGYASGKASYGRVNAVPATLEDSLREAAIREAAEADLVIYIGGLNKNHRQDCEDGDRESLALPFRQDELIEGLLAVNPRVVVVVMSGNAVAMPWVARVPAIVQGWYLGSEAGHALADVLSGDVNPNGRLPFSFPVKLDDCAAHATHDSLSYPGVNRQQTYVEDILVGYRWHDTRRVRPLFAFGHGLSYTTFAYGKARISSDCITAADTVTVTVPVTNTGAVAGAEVVQLYVGDDKAPVVRPTKELRAFAKVTLQPGETRDVELRVAAADLAYYDEATAAWRVEAGTFTFYVAAAADDVRQKLRVRLTETFTRAR